MRAYSQNGSRPDTARTAVAEPCARRTQETADHTTPDADLPPGAPTWITADLIRDTVDVWQPYYDRELTADDAVEILQNVAHMFDALE